MIRRLLGTALRVTVALFALLALLLTALWLTNPKPTSARGWEQFDEMPLARGEVASAVTDNRLYVVGGLRGFTTTSGAVTVYDFETGSWERMRWTVEPRHHAAAVGFRNRVFVTGGASSATDWTPSAEMYTLRSDGASRLPAMPEGRQGHAMVALDDKLYVVGGVGSTDRTLIYDPATRRWSTGAPLPEGRDHLRAVVSRGRIWAIGGRAGDPLRRVDIYDPDRDSWAPGPDLPKAMSAMAVGVVRDEVHVVGGEDPDLVGGGVSDDHFVLEEGTRRWTQARTPPLPVHGAAFGVHEDTLIVAGGAARQGALSTISWTDVTQAFRAQD